MTPTAYMEKQPDIKLFFIVFDDLFDYDIKIHAQIELLKRKEVYRVARKYAPDDWEKRLMKLGKLTRTIHIACEDLDFIWSTDDLAEFRDMWRRGFSVEEIREYFDRENWHEVIIIALDQIRWGYIKPRSNMLQVEGVKA